MFSKCNEYSTSWRHTKPISVRNRSGYIKTAVWYKCSEVHRPRLSLSNSNFWKAQLSLYRYSRIWTSQVCNALAVLKLVTLSWEYGLIHGRICWEPGNELGNAGRERMGTRLRLRIWVWNYERMYVAEHCLVTLWSHVKTSTCDT